MMRRPFSLPILLLLQGGFAIAAPPTIDSVLPAGGKAGTGVDVTFVGKCAPWPCQFWASDKGVSFVPNEKSERVGKIKLDPKTKPGPVWFRFFNAEGSSEPRLFYVGTLPEVMEDEKVDHGAVLQPAKLESALPFVMNGRLLNKNEVDFFSVPLKKGQTLHIGLDAYALRSLVDPMIHIYDAGGSRLMVQHDGPTNLDPQLSFPVPADGNYTIGVLGISHPATANVSLQGSTSSVYRLYLATDKKSLPNHFSPSVLAEIPAKPGPQIVPVEVITRLKKAKTPDRIVVSAKKGDSLLAKVEAFVLGFETDPVLRIFKTDGSLLRETDDVKPNRDAEYLWKVAADGDYEVEVADRYGRAGDAFGYRLTVAPPLPDFSAKVDKHSYEVKAGASIDVKVTVARLYEHKTPLSLEVSGAKNVEVELPKEIPEKPGDVTIKLTAKDDAAAFRGPISIKIKETEGEAKAEKEVVFSLQDSAARGPFLRDELSELWLTVIPKPEPKKPEEKPKEDKPKEEAKK